MVETFERFFAEQVNKTSDTTSQLGRKSLGFSTLPSFSQDILEIWDARIKTSSQDEGVVFVPGHDDYSLVYPLATSYTFNSDSVDNTANGVIDESVNNYHGTLAGYTTNDGTILDAVNTTFVQGTPLSGDDYHASFSGAGTAQIEIPYDTSLDWDSTGGSISLWIYIDDLTNSDYIFSNYISTTASDRQWLIYKSNATIRFYSSDSLFVGTGNLTVGWHHIGCKHDGTTATIIVDGETPISATKTLTVPSGSHNKYIGSNDVGNVFWGNIAYVRLWKGIKLTEDEFDLERVSRFPVKDRGLVGSWNLNENADDTNYLVDSVNNEGLRTSDGYNSYPVTNDEIIVKDVMSFSFWFKENGISASGHLWSLGTDAANRMIMQWRDDSNDLRIYDDINNADVGRDIASTITQDTWHHIVNVFHGDMTNSIYLDGVYLDTKTFAHNLTDMGNSADLRIGKAIGSTSGILNGVISNFLVTYSEFNQTDITTLYNEGNGINGYEIPNLDYHFKFNGNYTDSIGLATTPAINNMLEIYKDGYNYTQALQINEFYGYVAADTTTYFNQRSCTFACWVKIKDWETGTYTYIFHINDDEPSLRFTSTGTHLLFAIDGGTTKYFQIDTDPDDWIGKWKHIVCVLDYDNEVSIYIDGVKQSGAQVGDVTNNVTGSRTFRIGGDGADSRSLNGLIGDFRVYGRGLDETECVRLYNDGNGIIDNNSSSVGSKPIGPNWTERELMSVNSAHNLYPECFNNIDFVDSTSDGNWTESTWIEDLAIADYKINGDALDSSENQNDATLGGTPSLGTDQFGNSTGAYEFNGSTDYLDTGISNDELDYTIVAAGWFKADSVQIDTGAYGLIDCQHWGINYDASSNRIQYYVYDGSSYPSIYSPVDSISSDEWFHVALKYTNGTLYGYLNGELVGTDITSRINGATNIRIGMTEHTGGRYLTGSCSTATIFNNNVTDGQIKNMYQRGATEINNLHRHYKLNGDLTDYGLDAQDAVSIGDELYTVGHIIDTEAGEYDSNSLHNSGNYLTCPTFTIEDGDSLSFWVRTESYSSGFTDSNTYKNNKDGLFVHAADANDSCIIFNISGHFDIQDVSGNGYRLYNTNNVLNTWIHYTILFDIDGMQLYRNGEWVETIGGALGSEIINVDRMAMGYANLRHDGQLQDIRFNKHILTVDEITRIYNEGVGRLDNELHNTYLDSNTYIINEDEFILTDYIAKEDKTYTSIKPKINAYNINGTLVSEDLTISAFINSVEYPLVNNVFTTIPNSSNDGIKIKVINPNSNTIKIEGFTIEYLE